MIQYDFLNLSPFEFENLTRDLLQKEFATHIESFTDGSDGGIDLRFAGFNGDSCIVQCKRYKDFNPLFSNLKKEIPKIEKLNPTNYYVSTSVGLTPLQKKQIANLLSPFVKSEANIFGRNDLNNLLGKYEDIETKYTKLWLSSTNILQKILHSKIFNQSQFEIEKIKETIKIYVQNESFNESLKIINDHKFVIISGIPGIGKTTLARFLVYDLLAKGFDEFVFISNSISEGYTSFHENKKQVFLFDDFLGSNFLKTDKPTNEDKAIIEFIEKIKKSKNKVLIFTTREYILTQAKQRYESFNNFYFDKSKFIIDLSKYTKLVKAQILYNHLFFSELPSKYVNQVLKDNFYMELINHKNYSPRIIEVITQKWDWEKDGGLNFPQKLKSFFDFPDSIWRHVYEQQITSFSRCILAILLTTGTPILYEDLLLATQAFAEKLSLKYKLSFSEQDYREALKELENTFIITNRDIQDNVVIEYHNPSIQDFLVNYISDQKNLIKDLIDCSIYFEQFTKVFSFFDEPIINGKLVKMSNKIFLNKDISKRFFDKVIADFDSLGHSTLDRFGYSKDIIYWKKPYVGLFKKLWSLSSKVILSEHPHIRNFIKERFINSIKDKNLYLNNDNIDDFINLLREFKEEIDIDSIQLLYMVSSNFNWYQELRSFKELGELFPDEYKYFVELDERFQDILANVVETEYLNSEDLKETLDNLVELEKLFYIDTHSERMSIEQQIAEKEDDDNDDNLSLYDDEDFKERRYNYKNENTEIINMFNSLKDY